MTRQHITKEVDPTKQYEIILYYKYTKVKDPVGFMYWHKKVCERLGLTGRVLIAQEGINGTLEGTVEAVAEYKKLMHAQNGTEGTFGNFSDMVFKKSIGTGSAFPKLKVKVREEVVALKVKNAPIAKGNGVITDIDPNKTTGVHLKPEELKAWYENGEDFLVVDMRNDYEFKVGHFKNSINPKMNNFRELPEVLPKLEEVKIASKEGKKILTVCTGGIRCEKASGFLMENGFENVYQLDGGMHTYMEKYPGEDFLGALFVFDNRDTMAFTDKREIVGKCDLCGATTERFENCANDECHTKMLVCTDCVIKAGNAADAAPLVFCSDACRVKGRIGKKQYSQVVSE